MNINIRLNKNFTTQLNKLDQEYGEEFRKLQGLDSLFKFGYLSMHLLLQSPLIHHHQLAHMEHS